MAGNVIFLGLTPELQGRGGEGKEARGGSAELRPKGLMRLF